MRPTLKSVVVTYELNGHTWEKPVELASCAALFWDEEQMVQILGAFYKAKGSKLTVEQAVAGFGPKAAELFKKRKKRPLTKKLLRELWNIGKPHHAAPPALPPEAGQQAIPLAAALAIDVEPVLISKEPGCVPSSFP